MNALKEGLNIPASYLETVKDNLAGINTSQKNSLLFNFQDINPNNTKNTVLSGYCMNWNCVGPSVRQERADAFGRISFYEQRIWKEDITFNGTRSRVVSRPGISIQAGATHNWGGQNHTPYNVLTKLTGTGWKDGDNIYSYLNKAKTDSKVSGQVWNWGNTQNGELPPPHNEFWLCRQGFHMVYKVNFADSAEELPEYLQNGFLKFEYDFIKPTLETNNWFGTFMIADDYTPMGLLHYQEASASGPKWPKEKYWPYFKMNKNATSIFSGNKAIWFDPKDVPDYGNYYIQGSGYKILPLNKIVGKYLIFGVRGTYTNNTRELDNNRYCGDYSGATTGRNVAIFNVYNFQILPTVYPFLDMNNTESEAVWKFANTSCVELYHGDLTKGKSVGAEPAKDLPGNILEYYDTKSLGTWGGRYYTTNKYVIHNGSKTGGAEWTNDSGNPLPTDFMLKECVVSDTIMAIKTRPTMKVVDLLSYNVPLQSKNDLTYYWLLSGEMGDIPDVNLRDNSIISSLLSSNTVINITNGSPNPYGGVESFDSLGYRTPNDESVTGVIYKYPLNDDILNYKLVNTSRIQKTGMGGLLIGNEESFDAKKVTNILSDIPTQLMSPEKSFLFNVSGNLPAEYTIYNTISPGITTNNKLSHFSLRNLNKDLATDRTEFVQLSVNMGFAWLKLLDSAMTRIKTLLQTMNGAPYYYYSPYETSVSVNGSLTTNKPAQQVKFSTGYLYPGKPTVDKFWEKYDDILSKTQIDTDCYSSADGGIVYGSYTGSDSSIYGITSGHLEMRRGVGFAWPLLSGTSRQIGIDISADGLNSGVVRQMVDVALFDYGFIDAKISNANTSSDLVPEMLPSGTYKLIFDKKIEKARPEVWNIPYVWDTTINAVPPIKFYLGQEEIPSSDIWYSMSYPLSFTQNYLKDEILSIDGTELSYGTSLGKLLDLNAIYKKFRTNPDKKLTMVVYVSISLGNNSSNVVCYGLTSGVTSNPVDHTLEYTDDKGLNGVNLDSEVIITGYTGGSSYPMGGDSDPILSGGLDDSNFKTILSGSDFYCFIQNGDSDILGSVSTYFGQLRLAGGSLAYEYPAAPRRIITCEPKNFIQFTYEYTFKNLADFVLFSMGYRHNLNHYFGKLNLMFKNIRLKNNIENSYDNPATVLSSFINSKNYVNGTNYSLLLSYEELINYDVIWKGFPYNFQPTNTNNLFNTEQATDIVDGYGANNWIRRENHSSVIGISDYEESIETITQSYFTTSNNTGVGFIDGVNNGSATKDENYKRLISFFRPLWIEYSKMYNISYVTNWDKFLTYTVGNGASSKPELNSGIAKVSNLTYAVTRYSETYNMTINGTYMVNWNMWTPDYGFTDNNKRYNIDKILNADVPFNGLIEN